MRHVGAFLYTHGVAGLILDTFKGLLQTRGAHSITRREIEELARPQRTRIGQYFISMDELRLILLARCLSEWTDVLADFKPPVLNRTNFARGLALQASAQVPTLRLLALDPSSLADNSRYDAVKLFQLAEDTFLKQIRACIDALDVRFSEQDSADLVYAIYGMLGGLSLVASCSPQIQSVMQDTNSRRKHPTVYKAAFTHMKIMLGTQLESI
ncbi:MAG: hypothetical protein Q3962_05505 [Corynebacterium sp.]|nr:hypothetical protein [Corynebacterium sp.]